MFCAHLLKVCPLPAVILVLNGIFLLAIIVIWLFIISAEVTGPLAVEYTCDTAALSPWAHTVTSALPALHAQDTSGLAGSSVGPQVLRAPGRLPLSP